MSRSKPNKKLPIFAALVVIALISLMRWGSNTIETSPTSTKTDPAPGANYKSAEREGNPSAKRKQRLEDADSQLSPHPKFKLFNDALEGNRDLLSWAGLKADDYEKFDEIIDESWRKLSADLEENAVLLPEPSSEVVNSAQGGRKTKVKDVKTYVIEASAERAEKRLSELKSALTEQFGRGAAERLIPYISRKENMGGFGNYSVKIYFFTEIDSDMFSTEMAIIEITDPETGKTAQAYKGYAPNSSLYRIIGTAFDKAGDR